MAAKFGDGFEVDVRVSSRVLTTAEQKKLTIFLGKASGDWDFDSLANFYDADDLLDWGFEEWELGLEPGELVECPLCLHKFTP